MICVVVKLNTGMWYIFIKKTLIHNYDFSIEPDRLNKLADDLVALFPTQIKDYWYCQIVDNAGKSHGQRGALWEKLRKIKYEATKVGWYTVKRRSKKLIAKGV